MPLSWVVKTLEPSPALGGIFRALGEHVVPSAELLLIGRGGHTTMSFLLSFCPVDRSMERYLCPHAHVNSQLPTLTDKPGMCVIGLPGDRTHYTTQTSIPRRPWLMDTQLNCHLPVPFSSSSLPLSTSPHP